MLTFLVPFALNAKEEEREYGVITPSEEWPVEELLAKSKRGTENYPVSPEDQEIILQKLQKEPLFQALPADLKRLIVQNKEKWGGRKIRDVQTFNLQNWKWVIRFFSGHDFYINYNNHGGLYVQPTMMKYMHFVDLPVETPAVHPKTKKPYVFPSTAQIKKLSGADLAYVKAFTETVNRNLHYLGSTPIPQLDPKAVKAGKYIGTSFWPLFLVQPKTMYENSEKYKRRITTKHDELVQIFAKGDERIYALQDRLGTPFYDPQAVAPNAMIPVGTSSDCYGRPAGEILGIPSVRLEQVNQVRWPHTIIGYAYKQYFDAAAASCTLMREGMQAELSALSKDDKRRPAVAEVVKQAETYLDQIEGNARAQSAGYTVQKGNPDWQKVPETLLSGHAKAPKTATKEKKTVQKKPVSKPQKSDQRKRKTSVFFFSGVFDCARAA